MSPTKRGSLITRLLRLVATRRITRERMDAYYLRNVLSKPVPLELRYCLGIDAKGDEALAENDRFVEQELDLLDDQSEESGG